jgi:hypothetical protein
MSESLAVVFRFLWEWAVRRTMVLNQRLNISG